jgi:hypothetical protein
MGSLSRRLRFSKRSPAKNASTFERQFRGQGDSNSSEAGFSAEERRKCGALFACALTEIRTPVSSLKGLRPGPLDDEGNGRDSIIL